MKKTAIITGSTKGIGKATALRLGKDGFCVVVSGRNEENGIAVAGEIKSNGGDATFIRADVSKEEDVRRLVEETVKGYGQLDVMVNNAGIAGTVATLLADSTTENMQALLQTNVMGVYWGMKYAALEMQKREKGCIINLASIAGLNGIPYTAQYCASKHAVVGLTRATAVELGPTGIRVNAVAPGAVDTDILAEAKASGAYDIADMLPIGRLGYPSEIANTIAFIASDGALSMTGAIVSVDGGFNAK